MVFDISDIFPTNVRTDYRPMPVLTDYSDPCACPAHHGICPKPGRLTPCPEHAVLARSLAFACPEPGVCLQHAVPGLDFRKAATEKSRFCRDFFRIKRIYIADRIVDKIVSCFLTSFFRQSLNFSGFYAIPLMVDWLVIKGAAYMRTTEQQHNERKREMMEKCFACYAENGLTGTGIKRAAAQWGICIPISAAWMN